MIASIIETYGYWGILVGTFLEGETALVLGGLWRGTDGSISGWRPSGFEHHGLASLWSRAGALIFRYGEHFSNLQGLRKYKEKFDPEWYPKYLACPGGLALPRILTNIASLISGGVKGVVGK